MTLTLVTGRPNAGKSGLLYGPVLEAARTGTSTVVLLPTRPDARRAADEFAIRQITGVRTIVLDEWIAELWSLYGDGRRLIDRGLREALMVRACAETPLATIASSAKRPGFVRALASVAERLAGHADPRPLGAEDREMVAILRRYGDLARAEGFVEPGWAATLLGADPPPQEGPVAVNRFTDLSAAQESFVSGLAAAADVRVALPWEEDAPATEALTPLVRRLAALGEHVHVETPPSNRELGRLEHDLYRPAEPIVPTGAVVFAEAAGEEAEAVLAVDLAAEMIADRVEPSRIAIVFRNAAARAAALEAAAEQAGVTVSVDVAVPLAATALGKALLGLLDTASGRDASRERMMAFLHSPYSGAAPADVEQLDMIWRRHRASGRRLLQDAATRVPATAVAISGARSVCAESITPGNVKKWKQLLDALLVAAEARRGLAGAAGTMDCAVHREALRTLSALAGGLSQAAGEDEAREALCRTTVSPGGSGRDDAVLVTEVHRVRSRRFDAVILGGLTAKEFSPERPRSVAEEFAERLGISAGADGRGSERLLFYTAVTRPRKRLVLLRQATDVTGQALRPSVFWDEVLDLYRDPGARQDDEGHPEGLPRVCRPLNTLAESSVCYSPGRRQERASGRGRPSRPSRGALASGDVLAAVRTQDEFSVSELERYAICPYRWFVDRAVRPREIDVAFEAREAGSAAHEALAVFYERWSGTGAPRRVLPEDLPEALLMADEAVDAVLKQTPDTRGLAEELAAGRVRRWVAGVLEDDADLLPGYTPIHHELAFGREEERPFELARVALKGRIDRIDSGHGGLVVTDYKSAASVSGHASFAGSGVIQLPVYLSAAAALLGGEPHGAIYRSLRSRRARGFWREDRLSLVECGSSVDAVDAPTLASILSAAADRVLAAAEGIRSGAIAPVSGGCEACATCSAYAACGEARPR
ncbi:MAG: PD-(D/E)XK nuclease family protein [Anaerosomatales bacterium]|nr:PD-(D/E)XK nuclease family protein [Anaerosomatales bacterium]